jgi:hypothetical protein
MTYVVEPEATSHFEAPRPPINRRPHNTECLQHLATKAAICCRILQQCEAAQMGVDFTPDGGLAPPFVSH